TPPRRRAPAGRRAALLAVVLLLLIGAGWTVAWQLVALRAQATLEAWIEQRRALGDRIEHGPTTLGGFPLAVTVTARQVHWARENGLTLLTAVAPELVASAKVWSPMTMILRPSAGARASAAGASGALTGDA